MGRGEPMTKRYVILGNGIAGQTCAEDLRKADENATVTIVAAERHPLYNRVALPRYLRGQVRREKVFMRTAEQSASQNIDIHFETWATDVDLQEKVVHTNRGQDLKYDAILIATGGRPKPPPWPGSAEVTACIGFQTLDDTDAIIEKADQSERVLVMGGSFIGYELAEGVSFRKKANVTWIMRGPWFLRYVLDEEGGRLCRRLGEEQGVQFITSDEVQKFSRQNGRYLAETVNGEKVEFDLLTYGVGLDYYTEPVRDGRVELSKGIITDSKLRTSAPDAYAAGDIAVFYDLMVERHNQMGTWDNAEAHGKVAARNMAGADEDFFDVPTYTTTMFGSTLAVMGVKPDVQPGLESVRTFSFEEKFYRKLFFKDDRLVGAIMIGPPKGRKKLIEIMRSRQKIERPKQELLDPANLKESTVRRGDESSYRLPRTNGIRLQRNRSFDPSDPRVDPPLAKGRHRPDAERGRGRGGPVPSSPLRGRTWTEGGLDRASPRRSPCPGRATRGDLRGSGSAAGRRARAAGVAGGPARQAAPRHRVASPGGAA